MSDLHEVTAVLGRIVNMRRDYPPRLASPEESGNNTGMAGHSKVDKPVVILRKKRPSVATAVSPPVKKGKAPPSPQTSAPVAKGAVQKSQPPAPPVPVAPLAPVPESAPQPTPGPTGRSAAQRRRYEERQRFLQSPEFTQIATAMTTRWPQLFRVTPETIRPLALGIYHDLCAHLPDFPPKLIHHTLRSVDGRPSRDLLESGDARRSPL